MSLAKDLIPVLTFLGHSASKKFIQNSFYLMGKHMPSLPHRVSRTVLQQLNEAGDKDCQRTVTEIKKQNKAAEGRLSSGEKTAQPIRGRWWVKIHLL